MVCNTCSPIINTIREEKNIRILYLPVPRHNDLTYALTDTYISVHIMTDIFDPASIIHVGTILAHNTRVLLFMVNKHNNH